MVTDLWAFARVFVMPPITAKLWVFLAETLMAIRQETLATQGTQFLAGKVRRNIVICRRTAAFRKFA
jgi:hypothetical protein